MANALTVNGPATAGPFRRAAFASATLVAFLVLLPQNPTQARFFDAQSVSASPVVTGHLTVDAVPGTVEAIHTTPEEARSVSEEELSTIVMAPGDSAEIAQNVVLSATGSTLAVDLVTSVDQTPMPEGIAVREVSVSAIPTPTSTTGTPLAHAATGDLVLESLPAEGDRYFRISYSLEHDGTVCEQECHSSGSLPLVTVDAVQVSR